MAHILPETPPSIVPTEVLKTFKALKKLPDTFFIWHHLAPWVPHAPDFLIITHDQKALLVKVSAASDTEISPAAQMLLINDRCPRLGHQENAVLRGFLDTLELPPDMPLESLVVFPNIRHKDVLESRLKRSPTDPHWAGRELLIGEADLSWEMFLPDRPMERLWLEKLRRAFTPETIVPPSLTTRRPPAEKNIAGLADFLLDYDQEGALKADLELDPDGDQLASDFRLNIVNGVAGSGKTLILLYRLRLLYHLYPHKRFLVLTHNKPLRKDLESRFYRLEGKLPENIEWHTFFSWCHALWPKDQAWGSPVSQTQRAALILQIWESDLQDTALTPYKLQSEIDWIKDQQPLTKARYLKSDRRGRGFGLTLEQRQRLWRAYQAYQADLAQKKALDWGDIPQRLWGWMKKGELTLPSYDAILIDEVQFFAPLWLDLIKRALKPGSGHLFLVADPTQGFLGRKTTWKSMGVDARGRTSQLQRSYRTTQEIMQFATLFYRNRLPDERDADILAPNLLAMPTGAFPQVIQVASAQDEIARVANEVTAFLTGGFPRKDLYILHANHRGAQALIEAINHRLGPHTAMEPKDSYPGNYVRVTTINAGAGLESPIVFLVGLRTLFEEEQSLRLGDDERQEIIEANTRKVFMAATRAGQRLVFTYVGVLPKEFEGLF